MSQFLKSYDDVLEQILTAYINLDPSPDTTIGSPVYIKSSVLASTIWGLYKYQDYLANQIFITSSDTDNLNRHGSELGITRTAADTDETYRTKLLDFLRQPPAGGNVLDFETWAMTPQIVYSGTTYYVASATITTPPTTSPGTVWITIIPDDETILANPLAPPMSTLTAAVQAYIDSVRPVTASSCLVLAANIINVDVSAVITVPTGADSASITTTIVDDITAFLTGLKAGDPVYQNRLIATCIEDGALNVTSLTVVGSGIGDQPASPSVVYRAGTISVTV
jgi:uncharacterized phage protein gp47/JayE